MLSLLLLSLSKGDKGMDGVSAASGKGFLIAVAAIVLGIMVAPLVSKFLPSLSPAATATT